MDQRPTSSANLYIICLAFSFAVISLTFVAFFIAPPQNGNLNWNIKPENEIIYFALTVVALINAMLSIFAPALFAGLLRSSSENKQPSYQVPQKSLLLNFDPITPAVYLLTLIRLALAESIAIFGFILSFLNESPFIILPYALIALCIQLIVGPLFSKVVKR